MFTPSPSNRRRSFASNDRLLQTSRRRTSSRSVLIPDGLELGAATAPQLIHHSCLHPESSAVFALCVLLGRVYTVESPRQTDSRFLFDILSLICSLLDLRCFPDLHSLKSEEGLSVLVANLDSIGRWDASANQYALNRRLTRNARVGSVL